MLKDRTLPPLFCLLALWPALVAGQEKQTISIIPRFGLLLPDTYFYEEFANFADDEPAEWTTGSLGRAAILGFGVEVSFSESGVAIRGELSRSFGGWLSAVHGIIKPRVFFDPPEIVNTWLDVPSSITSANMLVVLPTRFKPWGIQPFATLGGGGKWYHFGSPRQPNDVEAILPSEGFTAAIVVGGGVSFSFYGLNFETQFRDTINKYWGKTQHDLALSQGLVWPVR